MSSFVIISWILCLTTAGLLVLSIWLDRSLLVKPSIIFLAFFHIMIQWAAAIDSPRIETYLPDPWVFVLLSQGFPLLGLSVSLWTWRGSARLIWSRLRSDPGVAPRQRWRAINLLGLYFVLFVPFYLSQIPLASTGLYAIFTNPLGSDLAREYSLKLVDSAVIGYGYAFMASVFGPMLAVLLFDQLIYNLKRLHWLGCLAAGTGLILVLVSVSLSGARSYPATILLTVLHAWFYHRGFQFNPIYVFSAAVLILGVPTLLTIWREGGIIEWANFWQYFGGGIFRRVFFLPMEMGLWHTDFYQTYGPLGIQAIPRLASLFDVTPINAPNLIALTYYREATIESVIANASYVFAYYTYFGPWSFVFSLLGLWALDAILWVYKKMSGRMLLPLVASIAVASIWFTSIEYTVVLVTNGFLALPVVAWLVDLFSKLRFRFGGQGLAPAPIVQNPGMSKLSEKQLQ
jgi:hypothetical protein